MRILFAAIVATLPAVASADVKVEVKKVHLCCGACVTAVNAALKGVDGVEGQGDQKAKAITFTAKDDEAARKAIDALAAAGYHGEVDKAELAMKDDSGVPAGKVKAITLGGIHNCCRSCTTAVKDAIKKVDGVSADTVAPKTETFEVTGDFDAAELVKSLNAAGFHVRVPKAK